MMVWELPTHLEVGGASCPIRTDYRDILKILIAFADPDLAAEDKMYVCLRILYLTLDDLPREKYPEAYEAAIRFIDNDADPQPRQGPRTMDWEQDAPLLFPAVNRAAGYEVRTAEYLHWWTFLGYFMEIKDSVYASVLGLRQKKAKGKKLEKWEKEYWQANKKICQLDQKLTEEEKEEKERLNALLK